MTIQSTAEFSTFSTAVWEVENQLDDNHTGIGSHDVHDIRTTAFGLYMTHVGIKLYQHYGDDEVCRAQKKINSEREEECYASPSICFLQLDSPV